MSEDLQVEVPVVLDEVTEEAKAIKEKPLSKRDYELAVKQAAQQRSFQLKQNKTMVEELAIEVAYWKAQVDLLKYRFEKMDYTIKCIELEPKYLTLVEAQQAKEAQDSTPKSVLS